MGTTGKGMKLGVNGFGRIGKLTAWHHINRKYFSELVINIGRHAGASCNAKPVIADIDEKQGCMTVDGIPVRFLRTARNPVEIDWRSHDVRIVVDTTGQFLDPAQSGDHPQGSIRGHLDAGAEKVIASAPFKFKDKSRELIGGMPDDAVTTVMGVNDTCSNRCSTF